MKIRYIHLLEIICIALLTSCVDYGVTNTYWVQNELHEPIIIHFESIHGERIIDTILSQTKHEIYVNTNLCKKNHVPEKQALPFLTFIVLQKDTIQIAKDFTLLEYWSYSSKKYEGNYLLTIDIEKLK